MKQKIKKKKPKIQERHRLLLKAISGKIGKGKTFVEAMGELGYSKSYSDSPDKIKETESWQALLKEQLPDELLMKVHKGLLKHRNWRARDAGLEKGYKLKGKYAPEKFEEIKTINDTQAKRIFQREAKRLGIID